MNVTEQLGSHFSPTAPCWIGISVPEPKLHFYPRDQILLLLDALSMIRRQPYTRFFFVIILLRTYYLPCLVSVLLKFALGVCQFDALHSKLLLGVVLAPLVACWASRTSFVPGFAESSGQVERDVGIFQAVDLLIHFFHFFHNLNFSQKAIYCSKITV
jgi:hypothetical protein